jgi:adenylate cyclase
MKSKYKALSLLFVLISLSISSAYLFLPMQFQSLDNRVRDFYFNFRGPVPTDERIVIVDIDEKSIKELGQWPWERNKIAKILSNLTSFGAGIIGLDIIFAEADKTSPHNFVKQWGGDIQSVPNYDTILADAVANTPTILGYIFDFNNKNSTEAPQIPAIFVEKHKTKEEFLPLAKGVLVNIPAIQKAAYSSGYINNIPDETGIIRSVPLLIKYDDIIYPSLSFELYRIASNARKVSLLYSDAGVEYLKLGTQSIKTDRFSRLYLNFRGPFKSYKYISAVDVFNGNITEEEISGKFILIGTSAYGLMDLRSTPMDSVIAGVEIHANLIDNLLHNDMLTKPSWEELANLAIIVILTALFMFGFSHLSFLFLLISFFTTLFFVAFINYYLLFTQFIIMNSIYPLITILISFMALLGIKYIFEFKQKELVKNSFSKKVSKQVMDDLLHNISERDFTSKEVRTTIYFSDIRSFTNISESLKSPKRITDFLNFYMNAMVDSIENNQGTIDKFIGDAIMAYWNAPLEVKNHADKAVLTALHQINKRDTINVTIRKRFGFNVDYGIGINTGEVVVGEIGSQGRSDYTIIGDSVNLASRLEGLCKAYKVRLVISEFTKEELTQEFVIQLLDIVKVKGKSEPVKIYEVIANGRATDEKYAEIKAYEKAHKLYIDGDFQTAQTLFETLFTKYNKYLYKLYKERCLELIKLSPEKFDGVFEFTTK